MAQRHGGLFGSLTFLFALIFGGFLTLLLSTDEKGEIRKEVKDKLKDIKAKLKEVSEKERVQQIFGEVSKEATARYREAKALLVSRLAEVKQAVETIDKDKYQAVVDQVVTELKKEGAMTAQQLKTLTHYLSEDYKKITSKNRKKKAA
jgi:hypothetical protein